MNEVDEGLEYAQMLEIPVSTVSVVKKRSLFSRKNRQDDLKDSVIGSVNRRVDGEADGAKLAQGDGGFVHTEDLSSPVQEEKKAKKRVKVSGGKIVMAEAIAACLIATGIFVTNIFVPNTVINTFMNGIGNKKEETAQVAYTDLKLSPVTSELSEATVSVTPEGVICFTDETNVYPVCDGEISSVEEDGGAYTVKIAHTPTFCSVITGLDRVYYGVGDKLKGNLPFAYSAGNRQVQVSMYDGDTLLNCYSLSGAVPVWNT